jgi:hypothetical protein
LGEADAVSPQHKEITMHIPAGQDVRDYLFAVEPLALTDKGELLRIGNRDAMRVALPLIGPSAIAVWQLVVLAASESPFPAKGLSLAPMAGLSIKSKSFSSTVHRLDRFSVVTACIGDVIILSPILPTSFLFRRVRDNEERPEEFHTIRNRLTKQVNETGGDDMQFVKP